MASSAPVIEHAQHLLSQVDTTKLLDHPYASTAVVGVLGHLWFQKFQPVTVTGIVSLIALPPTFLGIFLGTQLPGANLPITLLGTIGIYVASLVTSVVIYRLSPLHPLANYPGPVLCKISRFWAWYIADRGDQHHYYDELHKKYGTVVRTGPDHLHICDVKSIPTVLGSRDMWHKSARYEATKPEGTLGSLLHIVDPHVHAARRRIWEPAFTTTSVKGYEPKMIRRVGQLVNGLEQRAGTTVNLAHWVGYFAFDFMGDLAYGGAFNLMTDGEDKEGFLDVVKYGIKGEETYGKFGWIKPFYHRFLASKDIERMFAVGAREMIKRKEQGSMTKDLFYYLLDEDGTSGHEPLDIPTLVAEATLTLVAGSDTTDTALANIFYYLLITPAALARVREEADAVLPTEVDAIDPSELPKLVYLQACIDEALRLQPAVPNGVQRLPPPDGPPIEVAGHIVPPGTTVQIPSYSIQRDPRYFWPKPNEFWPERWLVDPKTTKEEFRLNRIAYMPFNYGPTNCIGKGLAMQEMRMVVAAVVRRFDFKFAPGYDHTRWEKDLKDFFVLTKGELPVVFTPRE